LVVFPLIFISDILAVVYILTFFVSLITQFFVPAEAPMIPHLVPKKLLISANAIFSIGIYGSMIIAYALSGPLLLFLGEIKVFILITLLFAISAFFAFFIEHKYKENPGKQKINIKNEIKEVIKIIRKNKKVYHSLLLLVLLQTIILVIAVTGPGYATHVLNIQVEKFPFLFVTPVVIGMAIGAVLIGNYLHNKDKTVLAQIGLLSTGFVLILLVNLGKFIDYDPVRIMIVLAGILGFAFSFVFIPSNTIIQEETTDESRGKIYGSLNNLVGIVSLIPVLGVGLLADKIGVVTVLTLVGVGVLIFAVIRVVKFK